jgi:alkylated DNA repair dioxygenase AlkB
MQGWLAMADQINLFGEMDAAPAFPDGFAYQPELISPADEALLLDHIRQLPFREFEFQGFTGKRRVVSFGWRYDFTSHRLETADPIPGFLVESRNAAARFAGLDDTSLEQALVTEYSAGAAIGWHRDRPVFGDVIGISLLSPCTFRLRRQTEEGWERVSLTAEPRSVYLLRGSVRTEWEHSIPAVDTLRYSITFRTRRTRER